VPAETSAPQPLRPYPSVPALSGARQSTLRATNLALVLRTVCGAPDPLSRADIAAATAMTRATASRLVDELVANDLLDETERAPQPRRGRPATPLVPGARFAALGLQVDAGLLAGRVLDLRGRVIAQTVEDGDFVGSDPGTTLTRLGRLAGDLVTGLPEGLRLVGAGLALPGIVDADTGVLLRAPNLGWTDERPAELLRDQLPDGLALRLGNEADLAARAFADAAPGRPGRHRDFLYLSGQIGVGGAIVHAGEVMGGSSGWAGEIGHVCVDPGGPVCRCGSTGCLERYAGRHALLAGAGLPLDAPASRLRELAAGGDPSALRAIATAAEALGIALASVVNVLDVPTIVLGGHLGELADLLHGDLDDHLSRRVLSARWRRPQLVAAESAPAAGATGAALRSLSDVVRNPARWLTAVERGSVA
jgi:predicted NBD/HSP70 family sugar kinase